MPTYEYRCKQGCPPVERFSILAATRPPVWAKCSRCGKRAYRVFSAPAVHFKGKGFYSTDYRGASSPPVSTNDSDHSAQASKAAADKALDKKKKT